jgi:hypothetical protein
MWKTVKKHPVTRFLISLKLTVVCLLLLTALTVWGTLFQAEHGLYAAQQKFFHSWVTFLWGMIPVPGAVLIMMVLFVNLLFSLLFRIGFRLKNIGNILIHAGMMILLIGGFLTFYSSEESYIQLLEGQSTRFSQSNARWELAVWRNQPGSRRVFAVDTDRLSSGDIIDIKDLDLSFSVLDYLTNCAPRASSTPESALISSAGIVALTPKRAEGDPGSNRPGLLAAVNRSGDRTVRVILYGGNSAPLTLPDEAGTLGLLLRKRRHPLPFGIRLLDFKMETYPGSTIPKSYQSRVHLDTGALSREASISMNKPLRYKGYTLYQSSYQIAPDGRESTVLAVVRNVWRLFPYIASTVIFLGMAVHFLVMLFRRRFRGSPSPGNTGDPAGAEVKK